jgi:chemotaxis protein MotB
MSDPKAKIIIKKVKKITIAGGHGGSWKVAYADFVTAMMAFFLLLWLLSMVSPEKKVRMSTYFKNYSIFEKSGTSFMDQSSSMFNEAGDAKQKLTGAKSAGKSSGQAKAEEFKESIKKAIEGKLSDIKDHIMVDVFEGGVRVQLVDTAGKPMFELGSPEPTPVAQRIMQVIGEQIKGLPNQISVEGHTDALTYRSSAYGNWELSTERALSAKKQLESFGLDTSRLTRVAGYADTVPLIKEDAEDPRNRRISIILLFPDTQ